MIARASISSAMSPPRENGSGTHSIPDVDIWLPVSRPRRSSSSSSRDYSSSSDVLLVYLFLNPASFFSFVSQPLADLEFALSVRRDSATLLDEGDARDYGSLTSEVIAACCPIVSTNRKVKGAIERYVYTDRRLDEN